MTITTNIGLTNVDPTVVTSIVIVSGNNQQVAANANFVPFVVQARNGLGNGVPGFSVTFTAPGSAASCRFAGSLTATVASDSSGNAASPTPVATGTLGTFTVTASGSGVTTQNFNEAIGLNYLAEVCTAFEVAGLAAIDSALGQSGTSAAWTNPANAGTAAAGASFASNNVGVFGGAKSHGLLLLNPPASWLALQPDCKITQLKLQFSIISTAASGAHTPYVSFVRNGVIMADFNLVALPNSTTTWGSKSTTYTVAAPPSANAISGADLSLPNTQFMINVVTLQSGSVAEVNGVQVSVCYQNVDKTALNPRPTPLQFCEA